MLVAIALANKMARPLITIPATRLLEVPHIKA